MRQFRKLHKIDFDANTGELHLVGDKGTYDFPALVVKRQSGYVMIGAYYGPLEVALRLSHANLVQTLQRLKPTDAMVTMRQVGSTNVYLALGLQADGSLLLCPTVAADSRGHFTVNLQLTPEAHAALDELLLGVEED
ncbi:MAG UNVERIFIED_CONTAM: hypothetical protein LVT10_04720 [Anaerolineae bacterium]|jgi:hypothetical protein